MVSSEEWSALEWRVYGIRHRYLRLCNVRHRCTHIVGPHGASWGHMRTYGTSSSQMNLSPYGAICGHVGPCGPVWGDMLPYGGGAIHAIWDQTAPYGPIFGHVRQIEHRGQYVAMVGYVLQCGAVRGHTRIHRPMMGHMGPHGRHTQVTPVGALRCLSSRTTNRPNP